MKTYDEQLLKDKISKLPHVLRVLFANACGARLLRAYARYSKQENFGDPELLNSAVELLWRQPVASEDKANRESMLEVLMEQIPGDDAPESDLVAYAEDGAAAVAYALMTSLTGDPQKAAWAARRIYESVDQYIIRSESIRFDDRQTDEETIMRHPLMQAELSRQERDIDELLSIADPGKTHDLINQFKTRAESETAVPL